MKALTIYQPWASLIMLGAKSYEFRGHRTPKSVIGQRIVIHASVRAIKPLEIQHMITALTQGGNITASMCLKPDLALPFLHDALTRPEQVVYGAGVGTAVVGEPRDGNEIAEEFGVARVNDSDRDEHGNWGWPMLDVEVWPLPIRARGLQGIWRWPEAKDLIL